QADQGMETPAELWFTHARAALEAGYPHIAITSATRYLQEAGREGQDYRSALALLDEARGRAEGEATPTPAPTPTPTPASTPTALSGGEVEGLQPSEPGMGGPEVASAQTPVSPGQRVRLTMAHGGVVIGTVAAIGGTQSLTVNAEGGSPVEVNLEEVDMLEVSRGRQSTVKKGILGGGTAGLLGGLLNEINRAGEEVTSRATDKILAGATTIDEEEPLSWGRIALSGAGGALIGGVLGYFLLDEDWNAIPGFGETGTTNLVVELYRGSAGFSVGLRLPFGT
ncbi:MAG: hypothetical protein OXE73_07770, partial [Gammaproteobacteria bacterium]|nr:hypothetical protein [Gammaproteobacteria bacterium]